MSEDKRKINLAQNQLLRVLPESESDLLLAHLEPVELSFRQVLCEAGDAAEYVYFPLDSIVSVTSSERHNKTMEWAMVGSEGLTSIQGVFGFDPKLYRSIVQVEGKALRIKLDSLREQLGETKMLSNLLMRYMTAFYVQVAQVAACNRFHKIEQRLQTWLMMMFDRIKTDELCLTQDDIAMALGYRRPSLAEASIELQKKEIIRYSRGRIRLLNCQQLKANTCECYKVMETQYDQIFVLPANAAAQLDNHNFNFGAGYNETKSPEPKNLDTLSKHFQLTRSTIDRIRRSCEATEEHCRRQIEFLNLQRKELKLTE